MARLRSAPLTVGLVVVILASSLAWGPTPARAGAEWRSQSTQPGPDDPGAAFNATANVSVWRRAVLPLRVDHGRAMWTVPNAFWVLRDVTGAEKPYARAELGPFRAGAPVTLEFVERRAGTSTLAGGSISVVAVRVDNPGVGEESALARAVSLLERTDDPNASYSAVGRVRLDDKGRGSVSFTPDRPGYYVVFAAASESDGGGLGVEGDDLSITGAVTVVGLEQLWVHGDRSRTSAASARAGAPIRFAVDAGGAGGAVNHVVAVYDEATFAGERFTINLTTRLEDGLRGGGDPTELEYSVRVNGERRIDAPARRLGIDLTDDRVRPLIGVPFVFDLVAAEAGRADHMGGEKEPAVLNASIVATAPGRPSATVRVPTRRDWPAGEYRWLHVAYDERGSVLRSSRGTVAVHSPTQTATATPTATARPSDIPTRRSPTDTTSPNPSAIPDTDGTTDTVATESPPVPGFTGLAALVALVIAAGLAARKRR